jgi:hypothetical protein
LNLKYWEVTSEEIDSIQERIDFLGEELEHVKNKYRTKIIQSFCDHIFDKPVGKGFHPHPKAPGRIYDQHQCVMCGEIAIDLESGEDFTL